MSAMSPLWRKSRASTAEECVEVAILEESVLVRHSMRSTGEVLEFTLAEWRAFLTGVRRGEFDVRV
jgi:Domain of unknown function (DUF397)